MSAIRRTISRRRSTPRSDALRALLLDLSALLVGIATVGAQRPPQQLVADGWYAAGSTVPGEYRIALEPLRRPGGTGFVGATIQGSVETPNASGLVVQSIRADDYRGRRIRLTAWLRTAADAAAEARLWMRVDGTSGTQVSDYMLDRPVTGTRDWAQYAVVLDVPSNALGISFGIAFSGRGQVWADDLAFEKVGNDVATTGSATNVADGHDGNGLELRALRVELSALRPADLEGYRFAPTRPLDLGFEYPAVVVSR